MSDCITDYKKKITEIPNKKITRYNDHAKNVTLRRYTNEGIILTFILDDV